MTKIRQTRIIDKETGSVDYEYTNEVKNPLYDEDRGFLLFHNARQTRCFPNVSWPELTNNEIAYLFKLSRQLDEHNMLKCNTVKKIAACIDLSIRRTYDFLFMMQGLHVIRRIEIGYVMNPLYFFAGKYLTKELYQVFKDELKPHLSDWARIKMEN